MTQDTLHRHLAAILAADVAGYSRLIEIDEVGTLGRFRDIRANVIDPVIARFKGKVVGTAGDSLLVEFTNALAAVECAIQCQNELDRINDPVPEERRILFRMGVNLGDVIAADGTIHGDGVNVAARLEKLSLPGGLCVSRNVYEQVEGKLEAVFTDLGEHQVKNIAKPIRVYRVEHAGEGRQGKSSARTGAQAPSSEKVSIAVLPFDNLSGDPEQGYFSDGITEDLITELSKFRELLVIARNSSFQFRGKSVDISEIGQKLDVKYVVEGSVRKAGNRVRITVQLIDAKSAAHVWAERYDRDLTDVFELQDEITRILVLRVAGHALSAAASRTRSRPTDSLSAYDCFLRAREFFTSDLTAPEAEPFLKKAIDLDPNFTGAYALLSVVNTIKYLHDRDEAHLGDSIALAKQAMGLDPDDARANHAFGFALTFMRRFEEAGRYLKRAIELNPNEVFFRGDYANWMTHAGDFATALTEIKEALLRDPYGLDYLWDVRGSIETCMGSYEQAVQSFHHMKTPSPWGMTYESICLHELGRTEAARECLARAKAGMPNTAPYKYIEMRMYIDSVRRGEMLATLHKIEDGSST